MRTNAWLVVAVLMAGCGGGDDYPEYCGNGQLDISEECDNDSATCIDCRLTHTDVTAHWSFETLSGDVKSTCLPGDPDVTVTINAGIEGARSMTVPCASGEAGFSLKLSGPLFEIVESVADHPYHSPLVTIDPNHLPSPGQLPTVVVYSDAGGIKLTWTISDPLNPVDSCGNAGISNVRVFVDDVAVKDVPCKASDGTQSATIDRILAGAHSVRLEGLNSSNVVAAAAPVDVTVLAGTEVSATAKLLKN